MLGVICPSEFEYRALSVSKISRAGAVVLKSGMGKLRSMFACAKLHREYPALEHILLIGFAGGLTPNLSIGDVIEPGDFIEQDYYAEPLEKFPNQIRIRRSQKFWQGSFDALMLTQDRFLTQNPYRHGPYAKKYKTISCDMESYAVAHYCLQMGLSFSVLKLISDCADENAEHDFLNACKKLSPKLNRITLCAVEQLV